MPLLDSLIRPMEGFGVENLSVLEAFEVGAPGLKAMGRLGKLQSEFGVNPDQPYRACYFPDGNASVARLLVRRLPPLVASGNSMEDIVSAKFDYNKLDQPKANVRIRLNSTVVNVEQQSKENVNVAYVKQDPPLPGSCQTGDFGLQQ